MFGNVDGNDRMIMVGIKGNFKKVQYCITGLMLFIACEET